MSNVLKSITRKGEVKYFSSIPTKYNVHIYREQTCILAMTAGRLDYYI